MTYPEIREFIDTNIRSGQPFPVQPYFAKLGIKYIDERESDNDRPLMGIFSGSPDGEKIVLNGFSRPHKNFGLKAGDQIVKLFGKDVSAQTYSTVLQDLGNMKVGDKYQIVVKRDGKDIEFTGTLFHRMDYNVLEPDPNATADQLKLRSAWMKNLPIK